MLAALMCKHPCCNPLQDPDTLLSKTNLLKIAWGAQKQPKRRLRLEPFSPPTIEAFRERDDIFPKYKSDSDPQRTAFFEGYAKLSSASDFKAYSSDSD
jgi:hypothetical protein